MTYGHPELQKATGDDCTDAPDGRCIECAELATCKACEAWLLESVPPAVTIEIDQQTTKKRYYFFRNDKSIGMIEILVLQT